MTELVSLVPHDPAWVDVAQAETARMRSALGRTARDIQHVGSTAVPGLCAKPILDVAILLASLADAPGVIDALAHLGYEYRPNTAHDDRRFLRGRAGKLPVHVHLFDEPGFWAQVAFRDALLRDVTLRAAYEALKQRLAKEYATDGAAYTRGKAAFIAAAMADCAHDATPRA